MFVLVFDGGMIVRSCLSVLAVAKAKYPAEKIITLHLLYTRSNKVSLLDY
jgi:hypothetical protein